ncbi:hypothetical protein [Bacterioplanoides pacificum]|uniref:DUF4375 domain-containing protein n=1 Tax=Bacterioplanoides pacificum TaxID=1171596 RepID=A0ABV7VRG2_9GAMM
MFKFWKKKQGKTDSELDVVVRTLAEYLLSPSNLGEFRIKVKGLSKVISVENLSELKGMFNEPPKESELFSTEKHGLGGWLSVCQFAILELVYNLGPDALPFIREIAWGEYDWTQGNAIELLIRFAADGVEPEEIKNEIKQKFPRIRFEAQLYAIQPLLSEIENDIKLKNIFYDLMEIEEFKEAYEELAEQ